MLYSLIISMQLFACLFQLHFLSGHKGHIVRNTWDELPYELNCIDHQCWGGLYWAQTINRSCKFKPLEGKHFSDVYACIWKLFHTPWKHIVLKYKKKVHIAVCFLGTVKDITETDSIKNITNIPHQLTLNFKHYVHF